MRYLAFTLIFPFAALLSGCGSSKVSSEADAQKAYLGLDASVDRAIKLGLDGYDAASSANIPAQTTTGMSAGTMTIGGQVDQGMSSNRTMNLNEQLAHYSDDGDLTYDTSASPVLSMMLKGIPTGTLSGSLDGLFHVTGSLNDDLTLSLTFTGDLEPLATDMTKVDRKPGTTHIVGTASSGDATYNVDVTK